VAAAGFVKSQQWSTQKGFQPRLLTKQLMQAQQVEQLQQLWQQHQSDFNAVHFSALMHQLSVLHQAAAAGVQQPVQQQQQDQPVQRSRRARQRQQQTNNAAAGTAGATASVAVAAAASAAVSSDKQYTDLENELLHLVEEFNNSSNGSEDLGSQLQPTPQQQQQKLVRPPQPTSQQWEQQKLRRQQQTAQQLAHTVAAYALSPSIRQELDARAVAMISHALAKVGLQDQQLLSSVVQATGLEGGLLNQLDAQQLCNLIWSVAVCVDSMNGVAGSYMAKDLTVSSSNSKARPGSRKPATAPGTSSSSGSLQQQAPAASTSSSSSLSLHQYELPKAWLSGVERAFGYKVGDASSAGLAMAVWGFCRLGLRPGPWLRAFFDKSGSQLQNFSSQELAMVAYALGKLKAEVSMLALQGQPRDGQQQQQQ
jgi:hypothetical protein